MRKIIIAVLAALFLVGCQSNPIVVADQELCYEKPALNVITPLPLTLKPVYVKVERTGDSLGIGISRQSFDNIILNNKKLDGRIELYRKIISDYKQYYEVDPK